MNKCLFCGKDVKKKYCDVSCQNRHQNKTRFSGKCFKRRTVNCEKCNRKVDVSNYIKHFNTCNGSGNWGTLRKQVCKYSEFMVEIDKKNVLCLVCDKKFKKLGFANHYFYNHIKEGQKKKKEINKKVGRKGRILTKQHRINISKALKGKSTGKANTIEGEIKRKEKLSFAASKNHNGGYKKVPYFNYIKNGKNIKLRGSYEVIFAKYLDSIKEDWIYEKQIRYFDEDRNMFRYILPDFYIIRLNKYFDTKGFMTDDCKNKLKIVLSQLNIKIHLVFKNDLDKFLTGENNLETFINYKI